MGSDCFKHDRYCSKRSGDPVNCPAEARCGAAIGPVRLRPIVIETDINFLIVNLVRLDVLLVAHPDPSTYT